MPLFGRIKLLLALNVAMTVVVPLMGLGSSDGAGVRGLLHGLTSTLVYTNVTAIPTLLVGPQLVEWWVLHKWPLPAAVLVATIGFAAVGCLLGQALLMWGAIEVPRHFWGQYLRTLRGALLLAIVFGMGAFSYASMRDRLRRTEEQLHEKEVAEERTRKLAAEARLQSLESRLRPHFLFNTLNSISELIVADPVRAEQIVGRLAALLRSSLDTTSRSLIPLEQELAMVQDYLDIERARFGDRLRWRIDVPAELQGAAVPPLSVQSLVENAVKHGITPQRKGGEVSVSAATANGHLRIDVSDTGTGFDLSAIPAGHGLDCLVGRLDALFGARAHLTVTRREGRCVVEMVLPPS